MAMTLNSTTPFSVAKLISTEVYDSLGISSQVVKKIQQKAISSVKATSANVVLRLKDYDVYTPTNETGTSIPQADQTHFQGSVGPVALYTNIQIPDFAEATTGSAESIAYKAATVKAAKTDFMNKMMRQYFDAAPGTYDQNSIPLYVSDNPNAGTSVMGISTQITTLQGIRSWQNIAITASSATPNDLIVKMARMISLLSYNAAFGKVDAIQVSDEVFDALSTFAATSFRMMDGNVNIDIKTTEDQNTLKFNGVDVIYSPYLYVPAGKAYFLNTSTFRHVEFGDKQMYMNDVRNFTGPQSATQVYTLYNLVCLARMPLGVISYS